MKKFSLCIIAAMLLFTVIPAESKALNEAASTTMVSSKTLNSAKAKVLTTRLKEINKMDFSKLNAPAKKELRTEVISIKDQLNDLGGGVYISVGAIIIIILLLILLL